MRSGARATLAKSTPSRRRLMVHGCSRCPTRVIPRHSCRPDGMAAASSCRPRSRRMSDSQIVPDSTIREVLERSKAGRKLLYEHGYDVGNGFVDVLSQHQSLRDAARAGRLRNIDALLETLNQS